MVKLTTELIMNSYQFINPVKDRELDLRGKRLEQIDKSQHISTILVFNIIH